MSKIFICYRRGDSNGYTGWLYDRLATRFGKSRIYRDIDSIPAGEDFVEEVQKALSRCSAVIVVIGRHWLSQENGARLKTSGDFVRQEIAQALKSKAKVFPVLVDGAQMPPQSALPRDIKSLARKHAIELRDVSFPTDVQHLIKNLEKLDGLKPAGGEPRQASTASKPARPPNAAPAGTRDVKRSAKGGTRKAGHDSAGEPAVVKKGSGALTGRASRGQSSARPARAKPNPPSPGTGKEGENNPAQAARKKHSAPRGSAAKGVNKVLGGRGGSAPGGVQQGSSTKQATREHPTGKSPGLRRKRRSRT